MCWELTFDYYGLSCTHREHQDLIELCREAQKSSNDPCSPLAAPKTIPCWGECRACRGTAPAVIHRYSRFPGGEVEDKDRDAQKIGSSPTNEDVHGKRQVSDGGVRLDAEGKALEPASDFITSPGGRAFNRLFDTEHTVWTPVSPRDDSGIDWANQLSPGYNDPRGSDNHTSSPVPKPVPSSAENAIKEPVDTGKTSHGPMTNLDGSRASCAANASEHNTSTSSNDPLESLEYEQRRMFGNEDEALRHMLEQSRKEFEKLNVGDGTYDEEAFAEAARKESLEAFIEEEERRFARSGRLKSNASTEPRKSEEKQPDILADMEDSPIDDQDDDDNGDDLENACSEEGSPVSMAEAYDEEEALKLALVESEQESAEREVRKNSEQTGRVDSFSAETKDTLPEDDDEELYCS